MGKSEIGGTEIDHTESVTLHKYIDVSKLTFEKSNVYKVLHSGKQVAEICKEYLVTSEFFFAGNRCLSDEKTMVVWTYLKVLWHSY